MRFTKMQGCGNDYIYVNCFEEKVEDPSSLAVKLSDRHFGIGSDGLILIEPSSCADAYMHMFNLDGSEGKMYGNGLRCVAKYIYDHGLIPSSRREASIETGSGIKDVQLEVENGIVRMVTADMGRAVLTGGVLQKIRLSEIALEYTGIDIGNPHAVFFLDDNPELIKWQNEPAGSLSLSKLEISKTEALSDRKDIFPEGVNAEFIEVINRREIDFRVWERGSGETLACGTGASASVAAGNIRGKLDPEVLVHLAGGDLSIRYDRETGHCYMTGPAVEVFSGIV